MVGRLMGDGRAAGKRMMDREWAAEIDTIEGSHGEDRGEGPQHSARQMKAGGFEHTFPQTPPNVVKVAPHDDGRLALGIGNEVMLEKFAKLKNALGASQPQMHIGDN